MSGVQEQNVELIVGGSEQHCSVSRGLLVYSRSILSLSSQLELGLNDGYNEMTGTYDCDLS